MKGTVSNKYLIALLIFFTPAGLYLLIKYKKEATKAWHLLIISLYMVLVVVGVLLLGVSL